MGGFYLVGFDSDLDGVVHDPLYCYHYLHFWFGLGLRFSVTAVTGGGLLLVYLLFDLTRK